MVAFVDAERIAADFGIGLTTARAWIKLMPHIKVGRVLRVSRSAYEAWKRSRTEESCESGASSGDGSERTGRSGAPTGPTSTGAVSRRGARHKKPPAGGKPRENSSEPIHVARPRKRRLSLTP